MLFDLFSSSKENVGSFIDRSVSLLDEHRSIVIVDSGPAGLTAAIYTARANLAPLVIRGGQPGGQLISTKQVENYPGFVNGILGSELMQNIEAQAVRFGAKLRFGTVTAVNFASHPFRLIIDGNFLLLADAVVIATGSSARQLGLAAETRLKGVNRAKLQRSAIRAHCSPKRHKLGSK